MSKKLVLVVAFIALVAGGASFLMLKSDSNDAPRTPMVAKTPAKNKSATPYQPDKQPDAKTQPNNTEQPDSTGTYLDYTDKSFAAAASNTRLIFFHAPWCPQCRDLEASIREGAIPAKVTILKANYDTSTELRQKYQVSLQTTVVKVDEGGQLVKKFVAYDSPNLRALIDNLL